MEWINVEDRLPEEETEINTMYFDAWIADIDFNFVGRVTDVKFVKGAFYEQILDGDGDISHQEKLDNVTHWMPLNPPEVE